MKPTLRNQLFYGDNLFILREHISNESIDLIYLDPPFNSNRTYNVLFQNENGSDSEAQIAAFEDTWHWNAIAENTYHEIINDAPDNIIRMISAFREFIGTNQMLAYLVMMTARLLELHRVLRPTGSLYFHCDPTASHYIKIVLDTIFGVRNFGNEIVWRRFSSHGNVFKSYGRIHDIIFWYTKSNKYTWNQVFKPLSQKYIDSFFKYKEKDGRVYRLQNVLNPNKDRPNLTYEWNGHTRVWKWTKEKMQKMQKEGLLVYSKTGLLKGFKQYLDDSQGEKLGDIWDDIKPLGQSGEEPLGYPTQKPIAILERIIQTSSDEGDIVLDPFCGCGTTVAAAHKLNRRWIGIDITHLSIALLKYRLRDMFEIMPNQDYDLIGEPAGLQGARQLAEDDRYQFQWWALSLVKAKPIGGEKGSRKGKKGKDKGIDGIIYFIDDDTGSLKKVLVQVKSGKVKSGDIRDLRGTIEREKAAIGVFITLEQPTKDMQKEAVTSGFYHSDGWGRDYQKIQILTIEELLDGRFINLPPVNATFKKAKKTSKGNIAVIKHIGKEKLKTPVQKNLF